MKNNATRWIAGVLLAGLLGFGIVTHVSAQAQLAVDLGHPVYKVIETAELRGVLTRLSSVKPYMRGQVAEYLATIESRMESFSPAEREQISVFAKEFAPGTFGESPFWRTDNNKAAFGVKIQASTRGDVGGVADLITGTGSTTPNDIWYINSLTAAYLEAFPASWISMMGEAGFTFDKIKNDLYQKVGKDLFLPYEFTKEWDGPHAINYFSTDLKQDIAASTDSGNLITRFSRYRRDWGAGSGSLSLSSTARPFVGLEITVRPSKYFAVSSLVGSLTNWEKQNDEKNTAITYVDANGDGDIDIVDGDYFYYSAISYQKMLGLQRLEVFPTDWLTLSVTSSLVGAKRFELGYFAPLLATVLYQNQLADIDNLGLQVDGSFQIPKVGKFYGSFYADEMEVTHLDQLFTKARNMFAFQGGLKLPLPGLPFFTLSAQYTKIEPFVYAHYSTWYPDYRLRVDTSYTNDGENLGYYLPPNSDEFLVKLETALAPGWRASLQYSFVRHGDNSDADYAASKYLIYGDVNKYFSYANLLNYADKNFLHDGIYDWNHIGKLHFYWRPAKAPKLFGAYVPLELGLGYGFSYTWWEDGTGGGAAVPDPVWKNVLELDMKLFL